MERKQTQIHWARWATPGEQGLSAAPNRGADKGERRAGGCAKGDAEQEEEEGVISLLLASPAPKKPRTLGGLLF